MPWEFEGDYPTDGIFPYTIGGKDSLERPLRFAEGWFGTFDVLYDITLRHLKLNGSVQPLGASCDLGDTVNKLRNAYFSGAVNSATLALSGSGVINGDLTVKGSLKEQDNTQWTLGSQAINHGATYALPKGSYIFYRVDPHVSMVLQVYNGSTWVDTSTVTTLGTVVSDGTNMRLRNNSDDTNATVYWRKKPV